MYMQQAFEEKKRERENFVNYNVFMNRNWFSNSFNLKFVIIQQLRFKGQTLGQKVTQF